MTLKTSRLVRNVLSYKQTNYQYFTGVGSQRTPEIYKPLMAAITYCCAKIGLMLRSGGARGADSFFESGIPANFFHLSEIIHTEENKNRRPYQTFKIKDSSARMEAMLFIEKHSIHENWQNLINNSGAMFSVGAHVRNIFQVLGINIFEPKLSKFLICYTPDGASTLEETSSATGGTRTAIRTAIATGVPVFNLANEDHLRRLYLWVSSFDEQPHKLPPIEAYLK